jgi:membrane-associated protease RseP (regulator of RpoE activity)
MNGGIVVAVFLMIFIFVYLILSLKTVTVTPQVGIALPGVKIPGSQFFVPFGYGIIALVTVIVVHEFGHGILARVEKVDIKSVGVGLIAILPIAFVEPDDAQVKKLSTVSKLRIMAAGSIFNMILAGLCWILIFALTIFVIPYALPATNLEIVGVVQDSPANGILTTGMKIESINGIKITDRNSFTGTVSKIAVGDTVQIVTNTGTYSIKTGANPNNPQLAYIGIQTQENRIVNPSLSNYLGDIPWVLMYILQMFNWILILNFGIGVFNLLPLKPFDGGVIFEELVSKVSSEQVTRYSTYLISIFSLSLILINVGYGLINALV